jgi:hypothetical protein
MSIEHIGLCVDEPFDMAIPKKDGSKSDSVVFIEDSNGKTFPELYNIPGIERINFSSLTPL